MKQKRFLITGYSTLIIFTQFFLVVVCSNCVCTPICHIAPSLLSYSGTGSLPHTLSWDMACVQVTLTLKIT